VLLQEALRGEADDRVLFVQHLGAPHLCQGEEDRHPRHLVLRPLQDQKYKRRGEGTRESQGEKKCTVHLLSRASEAAPHKYEEEVIIKNEKKTLPIIDSGSVLLRVVCLPQYKAPVSGAPSIHLSPDHHPPTFSHQCLTSHEAFSSQNIFGSTQEPFSIKCLSDYQCFKTDFR